MRNKNKKMKTTWLSLFLAFALLFTSLTGCGSAEPSDTSNTSTEQDSASELDSATEITSETESETESEIASETESETQSEATTESEKESEKNSESSNTQNNNNNNNNTSTGNSNTGSSNSGSSNSGNSNSGSSNSGSSNSGSSTTSTDLGTPGISLSQIPAYSTSYYITLNNNIPHFSTKNLSTTAYEFYSELDSLGRCGVAYACLGTELMPADGEEREGISSVKPTGWIQANYSCIAGGYLWNRSHLIAWSLANENANKKNLITGTQHMNQNEMTKFEDMVYDYIKETGNHVLYRVTPFFDGNNLVATGVQMEAWSIEDNGESICFNVFIYNVQDGVYIDYATGNSYEINPPEETESEETVVVPDGAKYAVNGNNGKIHIVGECSATESGNSKEMKNPIYFDTYEEALAYVQEHFPKQSSPQCGNCW